MSRRPSPVDVTEETRTLTAQCRGEACSPGTEHEPCPRIQRPTWFLQPPVNLPSSLLSDLQTGPPTGQRGPRRLPRSTATSTAVGCAAFTDHLEGSPTVLLPWRLSIVCGLASDVYFSASREPEFLENSQNLIFFIWPYLNISFRVGLSLIFFFFPSNFF